MQPCQLFNKRRNALIILIVFFAIQLVYSQGDFEAKLFVTSNNNPICGGVNPERKAYHTLKTYGADVEHFEIAGCDHSSLNPAFNQPDFLS
jgi:hypothetical protein